MKYGKKKVIILFLLIFIGIFITKQHHCMAANYNNLSFIKPKNVKIIDHSFKNIFSYDSLINYQVF